MKQKSEKEKKPRSEIEKRGKVRGKVEKEVVNGLAENENL